MTDHIGLPTYWALLFYQTDSIGLQDFGGGLAALEGGSIMSGAKEPMRTIRMTYRELDPSLAGQLGLPLHRVALANWLRF
jgi:hypothetical protein